MVGQFLAVNADIYRAGADAAIAERVAVGRCFCRRLHADVAAGAIIDDDLLTETFPRALCNDARDDVRRAAGGEGHDQANGFLRKISGIGRRKNDREKMLRAMFQEAMRFTKNDQDAPPLAVGRNGRSWGGLDAHAKMKGRIE